MDSLVSHASMVRQEVLFNACFIQPRCSCTSRMNMVPGQVIQSVAGITIVAKMSGRLAAIVLAGVTVRGVINYAYAAVNKRLAKAQQAALADSASVADQTLSLMPVRHPHLLSPVCPPW